MRLRFASRAVLGIGLAVALCGAAGHSLTAAITGGLAALLALFTVTDPTVRGQAITTALLPVAGLPVLTLAAVLHDLPVARDLAFLAVVGAGVYARRWGPRGHSLGVFGFMSYFSAQFLHTVPGQLPELYTAVLLSLAASSLVRFGLWCYERRFAAPVAVALPAEASGLARITTRQAVQATSGAAFALAVGQVLSDQRWYWAVGATWWVFVATTSRGETVVRGFRRFLGTVLGIGLGFAVAVPLHHEPVVAAVVVAVGVFGIFYTAAVSYTWMMLAVTVMASMLYGLLGVLDTDLLLLRVTETATGALGAVLAVLFVLPVTTHSVTEAWVGRALRCVHTCTAEAAARLAGSEDSRRARTCRRAGGDPGPGAAVARAAGAPAQPAEGPQAPGAPGARPARRLRTRGTRPGLRRRRPGGLARRAARRGLLAGGGGRGGPHRCPGRRTGVRPADAAGHRADGRRTGARPPPRAGAGPARTRRAAAQGRPRSGRRLRARPLSGPDRKTLPATVAREDRDGREEG